MAKIIFIINIYDFSSIGVYPSSGAAIEHFAQFIRFPCWFTCEPHDFYIFSWPASHFHVFYENSITIGGSRCDVVLAIAKQVCSCLVWVSQASRLIIFSNARADQIPSHLFAFFVIRSKSPDTKPKVRPYGHDSNSSVEIVGSISSISQSPVTSSESQGSASFFMRLWQRKSASIAGFKPLRLPRSKTEAKCPVESSSHPSSTIFTLYLQSTTSSTSGSSSDHACAAHISRRPCFPNDYVLTPKRAHYKMLSLPDATASLLDSLFWSLFSVLVPCLQGRAPLSGLLPLPSDSNFWAEIYGWEQLLETFFYDGNCEGP